MEDLFDQDDALSAAASKKTGLLGLLQRLRTAQPVPEPFRESDFHEGNAAWSAFEAPSGAAE